MHESDKKLPNRTHVACILLWYPLFTQPFIFREVEELKKLLPVTVHTLYGKNLTHCSEEMRRVADSCHTNGMAALPHILKALGHEMCHNPKRLWRLFRETIFFRWPNLEVLGENLWAFCMALILAKRLQEEGISVCYAPWPRGTTTCARVIQKLTGIPFVTTVRGDNLMPADPDLCAKMGEATYVRTNNLADKKRIEAFGHGEAKEKTHLIYNGLTLSENTSSPHILSYSSKRPLALMALGRFDVTKGFDILIEACFLLNKKIAVSLTLGGGGGIRMGLGKLEKELRALCAKRNLTEIVHFPGLISHNDLPEILAHHDIFVAPCVIDAEGRRDGIPNTVIEAMSQGLPVVASNIHALPEVVLNQKTGLTVPQKDPKALADAILWLAEHPEEAAAFGKAGMRHVQELFHSEKNAKQLADLLCSAAKNGQ